MDRDALRILNFQELIRLDVPDARSYGFAGYAARGMRHPAALAYCTACEDEDGTCASDGLQFYRPKDSKDGFRMRYISHGSTADDFMDAVSDRPDTSGWNDGGVMFVMENPSLNYDEDINGSKQQGIERRIYRAQPLERGGRKYEKWPAEQWYWIHGQRARCAFPDEFRGQRYGSFVASAVETFHLRNAYMTNLVKCGVCMLPSENQKEEYLNTDYYDPACVARCMEKFLKREIEAVQPRVIFAFGSRVCRKLAGAGWIQDCGAELVRLPHPSQQRGGITDEFFTKDKCLSETIRAGLHFVGQADPKL